MAPVRIKSGGRLSDKGVAHLKTHRSPDMRLGPFLWLSLSPLVAGCGPSDSSSPSPVAHGLAATIAPRAGTAAASAPAGERPRVVVQVMSTRYGLGEAEIAEVARDVPEAEVVPGRKENLPALAASADGLVGAPGPEVLRAAAKLRWLQVPSGGVEPYLIPEVADSTVVLTNAKIIQGPEIADHAMALLLALARGLPRAVLDRKHGKWHPGSFEPIELRAKTAVIIGLGGIGTQIAERAAAFGMTVLAVDPEDKPYLRSVEAVLKPDRLHDLLPRADVLFLAAPLTPATKGLIGARELALLGKGARVINVSRGELLVTDALVQALSEGRLAGAGLDVTDPEPLPPGHPLWAFENVIITPHIAGASDQVLRRRVDLVKENVRRFARGLPLLNVVDKRKGY
jgi:phosphoglycerate dehydrogenase-like enzyme